MGAFTSHALTDACMQGTILTPCSRPRIARSTPEQNYLLRNRTMYFRSVWIYPRKRVRLSFVLRCKYERNARRLFLQVANTFSASSRRVRRSRLAKAKLASQIEVSIASLKCSARVQAHCCRFRPMKRCKRNCGKPRMWAGK